jgi:hypothetical protein
MSDIALHSLTESAQGGRFLVSSETVNASSTTNVHSSPVDSYLDLQAFNSFGINRVKVPSPYEGPFTVRVLSGGTIELQNDDRPSDPAGEHRRRQFDYDCHEGVCEGDMTWEPQHNRAVNGSVRLVTTNAAAALIC